MIVGRFHEGSGLGDQLFRYITVRTLAEEKTLPFWMQDWDYFKGSEFMKLKQGLPTTCIGYNYWNEKDVRENGIDIRSYDPEINFIYGNTVIDGSFEDDKYWRHNLDNINKWLEVEPLKISTDLCVIGFRGGEYASQPDLFLTSDYWQAAIGAMGDKEYEIHTDDPATARTFFPYPIIENTQISHSKHSNMAFNWRSARYAKYAIIPNSAFFILPRILKHHEDPTAVTIAPRYWARRNTKTWARPACYYPEFTYL